MMKKIIIILTVLISHYMMAQQTPADKKLQTLYHQFDFWIGKWDVYKYGTDTLAGKSHIESIIDGVGLLENYSVAKGKYVGKSLNKYNPAKHRWEQFWIDNSGLTLFLTGALIDGKMIMDDSESRTVKNELNQIIWEKLKNGSVRQTWKLSKDEGKTWTVLFDGEYKPSKS